MQRGKVKSLWMRKDPGENLKLRPASKRWQYKVARVPLSITVTVNKRYIFFSVLGFPHKINTFKYKFAFSKKEINLILSSVVNLMRECKSLESSQQIYIFAVTLWPRKYGLTFHLMKTWKNTVCYWFAWFRNISSGSRGWYLYTQKHAISFQEHFFGAYF